MYQEASEEVGGWVTFSPVRPAQGTKTMLERGKEALVKKVVHAVRMAVKRDWDQETVSILLTATIRREICTISWVI